MRAAYDKYEADGLVVLSVSEQESNGPVEAFIDKYGLSYPFALDVSGTVGQDYRLYTTPTTYFITPEGVIQEMVPGLVTEFWVDQQMSTLGS